MAQIRGALVAAAILSAMPPTDVRPQEATSDSAAAAAYVDMLDSIYLEGAAIAGRVFDRYLAVDAFHRGEFDEAELSRRTDSESRAIRADIEAHFQRLKRNARPVLTGDSARDRNLLMLTLTIGNMTDLMRGLMTLTDELREAALAGDVAAYERIETDVFEKWSALYASRYNHLAALRFDIYRDDPRYGIHGAVRGVAEAGITTYKILAESQRDGAFDIAAYETAIDASLQLIEKSLSGAESAFADPSWPDAAPGESATARAARRERTKTLADRYAAAVRATAAALRQGVRSLRVAANDADTISGPEMGAALYALRLDIDLALSGIAELDPMRRELDRLGRAGETR